MAESGEVIPPLKKRLSLQELIDEVEEAEVKPGVWLPVRAISLLEIIKLFTKYREPFLTLWSQLDLEKPVEKIVESVDLQALVLASPTLIATIIAMATDSDESPENIAAIAKKMSASMQLIALKKIWDISVPDPKKLGELLSQVMGRLSKLEEEQRKKLLKTENRNSPTT